VDFAPTKSIALSPSRPSGCGKLNLILSVAVFPLSEHDRLHKLQQHWEVWASRGDVDLVVPMTYALDTYRFQRLSTLDHLNQINYLDFAGNSPPKLACISGS